MKMNDLGLSYEEAAHGVQSALAFEMGGSDRVARVETKHMRVGIDMSKVDMMGLAQLLMDKGVFTEEEYFEYLRVAANDELAREQDRLGHIFR